MVARSPEATILIVTRNRRDELRVAVRSALAQSVSVEVVVVDDGSTDGSSEMVRAEFPSVRLVPCENSRGLIVRRNQGAQIATAPIVVSIDDDAAFASPHTVRQVLPAFNYEFVGAVAIPYQEPNKTGGLIRQEAPSGGGLWVAEAYRGTAHALRRDLFLRLGGYREYLFHQGEEVDYCIRMLSEGYVVSLWTADPIHHYESPRRDPRRADVYGRRNDVLFAWYNVPWPHLFVHLLGTTYHGLRFGLATGRLGNAIVGLARGYGATAAQLAARRPVARAVYRLSRQLRRGPQEWERIRELVQAGREARAR